MSNSFQKAAFTVLTSFSWGVLVFCYCYSKYHKISSLKETQFIVLSFYKSEAQHGYPGVKSRCQQTVSLLKPWLVSLPFPVSRTTHIACTQPQSSTFASAMAPCVPFSFHCPISVTRWIDSPLLGTHVIRRGLSLLILFSPEYNGVEM